MAGRVYENQAGGSFGPANHGLCLADGVAFFKCVSVDLSPFAGIESVLNPYILTLTDPSGKVAIGYIGAADAAEALGSELLTNPGFES